MPSPAAIAAESPGRSFARALELHRSGRLAEAEETYRSVASAGGLFAADARINLGVILDENGRHQEALLLYREVLALRDGDPLALNNMGNSLMKLGRFAEAAESFRMALSQNPGCQEARLGLGAALQRDGDAAGAIASFREALQRDPVSAEAHWNLSLALLISGNFAEGWQEYQWRWRRNSFTSPHRPFKEPLWDGSPLQGRRILVHAEQGLGDTIQFMRYLPLVAAAGGIVLAECQSASLRPLLQRIDAVSGVFVMGERLPPFDLQAPLLSLPYLFRTTLETIPDQVPYLAADPQRVQAWSHRLCRHDSFRVGIVWAGKSEPDPFRSCTADDFAPLAEIPGVTLYSLQIGKQPDAQGYAALPEIVDLTPEIGDFGDTAALVSHLDLVISVDTAVAHLAGALGKPVWLLLPKAGDYRWLLERDDSPWYPTMRIFRQERQGEWGTVFDRVRVELKEAAWRFLEQAAVREPLNGWWFYRSGEFLAAQGRHREATVRFTKAAQLLPRSWEPHYSLAASLQQMGQVAEATESLERALEIGGDLALLHEALGITRQMQGDLEGAVRSYQRAVELDATVVKARFNLATACRDAGRFDDALAGFADVVTLDPGHADAHWNLAVLLLMHGRFESGWREFEWRFSKSVFAPVRRWQDRLRWDGSPLAGKTILLWAEQGLGDTLQFIRYAPMVAARRGRVLVEVQCRSLVPVIASVTGVSYVFVAGEDIPPFDLQASLLELPGIFAAGRGAIPADVPYLHCRASSLNAAALIPRDGSFRVGIVWQGNPRHTNDHNRSISLEKLAPLAEIPGTAFYSLQLRDGMPQLASPFPLKDLSPAIRSFADSAALAAELDLVITVDTSIAHLCGGLALPVWVLLPFVPDWRWQLQREDSPWYPTMRLFRQETPGDWDDVLLRVREALRQAASRPGAGSDEVHKKQGLALTEQGRYPEGVRELEIALSARPMDLELLNNLGCALDGAGRHIEAMNCYQRAITVKGDFMPAHYNLGNSLKALGYPAEAVSSYRRALSLDPELPQGWHNLALALQDLGQIEQAREALERAITLRPDYLEAIHNLGELYQAKGDLDTAMECYKDVLAQNPGYVPSWNSLGIALQVQYRLEDAVGCYEKALSIDPDYVHALNNLGSACKGLGLLDRAISCYQRVLELDPDYADAHWNLALVHLLLGRYEEGWQGYEWRFRKADPVEIKGYPQPLWDGTPLNGRVILLQCEQGFGDTIHFVRYASVLAGMGGVVLVECQSGAIASVVATVPGVARALVRGDVLPDFDLRSPLMSLPFLCGTRIGTIPAEIPYLCAEPSLVELWRARLECGLFKVGIVWAGRKSYQDDGRRSLTLDLLAPLGQVPGVRLHSLQVGEGAEQAATPPPGMDLVHLGPMISSFEDSAAIIENLDLVISADTAAAHLAGALGKPVWVLLPKACDWRWFLDRDDSPWYPSARLFRQVLDGEWGEVLERVAGELALEVLLNASALNPSAPELHNNAGVMLERLGRQQQAVWHYREALALRPDYREANCNLGNALRGHGRDEEALPCYRAALTIDPAYGDAHYNLGNALRSLSRYEEAVESYRTLLALNPDHLSGWINLGGSLMALNRLEEAVEAEQRASEIDPSSVDAHWNLALALLATGNYQEGWREYEWRLRDPAGAYPAHFRGRPMWDGSPLDGRTLLLRAEQGFGDALQFFRYLPHLAGQGVRVVLECRRELLPLLASQDPALTCFAIGDAPPPFDTFAYLMSLPFLLKTTLSNLPARIPYLRPDPALSALWRGKMEGSASLKVGLVWAGSAGHRNDRDRSLPFRLLEPLSTLPGIELYSLQLGATASGPADVPWGAALRDLSAEVRDFSDTAAIIANLDLVISVDTAVAHLAGAMGKELFLMLPESCDWRWLSNRSDSPWYPTMRLYRQPKAGAWEEVIAAIMGDLSPGQTDLNELFRAANMLRGEGRVNEAVNAYRRLLALQPECAEIHNNLGLALQDQGRLHEAAASYRRALQLQPDLADAHNNLGTVLVLEGDREAATASFRKAIALREEFLPAYVNLGCCLQNMDRPEEALPLYLRAVELQPAAIEARVNLGTLYQQMMQPEEAIRVYEDALRIDPQHPESHWNLALSLLTTGDFERGWREYEWRFAGIPDPFPRWEGATGSGGTILLECEQGLGDTLQFVRYAPLVAARGLRVVLHCQHPSLKPLLERVPGVAAVVSRGEDLPEIDCYAPLLSLPRILGTTLDDLPVAPYLIADPDRVASWRTKLTGNLKVGLVWRGGALPANRACPFPHFAPLSALPGISFYSLQLGEAPDPRVLPAVDLAPGIGDFADSAAIIANLDLLITVDTAAAHLAGGMGATVWVILPYACDWRWLTGRSDSPWYPSMRIFRQDRPGNWSGVIRRVKESLAELII